MCAAYPLSSFDTIDVHTGELDAKSALNLIVFGVSIFHSVPLRGVKKTEVIEALSEIKIIFIRFFRNLKRKKKVFTLTSELGCQSLWVVFKKLLIKLPRFQNYTLLTLCRQGRGGGKEFDAPLPLVFFSLALSFLTLSL